MIYHALKFRAFYYFEGRNLTKTHDTPEAAERWLAGLWLKEREGGKETVTKLNRKEG
jgi:hypothetical protein